MGAYSTIHEGLAFGVWQDAWDMAYERNRNRRPGGGLPGNKREREFRESMPPSDPGGKHLPRAAVAAAKDLEAIYVSLNGKTLRQLYAMDGGNDAGDFGYRLAWQALHAKDDLRKMNQLGSAAIKVPHFIVMLVGNELTWEGGTEDAPGKLFGRKERVNPYSEAQLDEDLGIESNPRRRRGGWVIHKIGTPEYPDDSSLYWSEEEGAYLDYMAATRYTTKPSAIRGGELEPFGGKRNPCGSNPTKTVAETRKLLAARPWKCSPTCPGWAVFDEGTDRVAIQRCDECMEEVPKHLRVSDDDVAQLPEAKAELTAAMEADDEMVGHEANPAKWPKSGVQSLLFDVDQFSPSAAKTWAERHGFHYGKVHTADRYHHLRQFEPTGAPCRTMDWEHGIKAVVCAVGRPPGVPNPRGRHR